VIFNEIEANEADGVVSIPRLRAMAPFLFHRLGLKMEVSLGQFVSMVSKVDKAGDHNDRLSFDEFIELVKMLKKKCTKMKHVEGKFIGEANHRVLATQKNKAQLEKDYPEYWSLFERLDTDGTNFLDVDEICFREDNRSKLYKVLGIHQAVDRVTFAALVSTEYEDCDMDDSGVLDFFEFAVLMKGVNHRFDTLIGNAKAFVRHSKPTEKTHTSSPKWRHLQRSFSDLVVDE